MLYLAEGKIKGQNPPGDGCDQENQKGHQRAKSLAQDAADGPAHVADADPLQLAHDGGGVGKEEVHQSQAGQQDEFQPDGHLPAHDAAALEVMGQEDDPTRCQGQGHRKSSPAEETP